MATKAQLARKRYGLPLNALTGGQKAQVTKDFNAQTGTTTPARATARATPSTANLALVKFARPGVNGLKDALLDNGKTVQDALDQASVIINKSKEGILDKVTGAIVMYNDTVTDGAIYVITPGVDSSDYF